jgi:hypothetical protein
LHEARLACATRRGTRALSFINLCDAIGAVSRRNLTEFVSFPDRPGAMGSLVVLYQAMAALYGRARWLHGKRERDKERNVTLCLEARLDALFFQCQDD